MSKLGGVLGPTSARLLGAVLLLAAYAKAIDPMGFAANLRDMLPVPGAAAYVWGLLVIAFEAGLGTALLGGARDRRVLLLTSATFLTFVGVVTWQLLRPGAAAACGCFGQLLERTPLQALFEDLGLVGLSGVAWLGSGMRSAPPRRAPAIIGAGAGLALALCAPWLPLDDHATALAP